MDNFSLQSADWLVVVHVTCRPRLRLRLPERSETDTLREHEAGEHESSYVRSELYGGGKTRRQQPARRQRK